MFKIADDCRVDLAPLYMTDKAQLWVSSYLAVRNNVNWDDLILDLTARFKDRKGINAVESFNKLEQFGTLEDHTDEFEHLRLLMQNGHVLTDEYVLREFCRGSEVLYKAFMPVILSYFHIRNV